MDRKQVLLGVFLIVLFTAVGVSSFRKSVSPYVTIEEAREGEFVQVIGKVVDGSIDWNKNSLELRFVISDETGTMNVLYNGMIPDNFYGGREIVVLGRYSDGIFVAEKILVKCPEKYQDEG